MIIKRKLYQPISTSILFEYKVSEARKYPPVSLIILSDNLRSKLHWWKEKAVTEGKWTAHETTTFWRGEQLGKLWVNQWNDMGFPKCLIDHRVSSNANLFRTPARNSFLFCSQRASFIQLIAFGQKRIFAGTSTTKLYKNLSRPVVVRNFLTFLHNDN